jgi:hypothetical protein
MPSVDSNTASLLAIYNYSLQRVVSRSLKFITSYYDWLYCQNVYKLQTSEGTSAQSYLDADNNPWSNPTLDGAGFLPPASLFTQVVQVLGWSNYTFDSVDVCNCFCSNLCQVIQLIANLDGNKVVRDFILENAFTCGAGTDSLGCGRLFDEGKLVDWGSSILSSLDVAIEVMKSLDAEDDPAKAEALLDKFCTCLMSAVCQAPAGGCAPCEQLDPGAPVKPEDKQAQINLRKQFFSMFMDLVKFLLFDRDCEFSDDADCCSTCPPSVEDYMQSRCKVGTNNGKCVVCSGACAGYRRKDDYKPMLSVILAVKYAVTLATLDRSGGADYASRVEQTYNALLSDYYNLYKDASGSVLTLYPDCAAPQFCCSTQNAAASCGVVCGQGTCGYSQGGPLCPIPCIDTRLATFCCGVGSAYLPNCDGGQEQMGVYVNSGGSWTSVPSVIPAGDGLLLAVGTSITSFCSNLNYNPCVVQPQQCNFLSCSTGACTNTSVNNGWNTTFGC